MLFFLFMFICISFCHAKDSQSAAIENTTQPVYQSSYEFIQSGQFDQAKKILKKALDNEPDNPRLHHLMGQLYLAMKNYNLASKYLIKAYQNNPKLPDLGNHLGMVYFNQSKYQQSLDTFLSILSSNPQHVMASYYAGMNLFKLKQYGKAIPYLMFASEKNEDIRANGYYHAAVCMVMNGNASKALQTFTYVQKLPNAGLMKDYSAKWIKEIELNKNKLKPYHILFKCGMLYDDNVRLEVYEEDYSDEDDMAFETVFDASYTAHYKSNIIYGAGFNHFQKWHTDLSDFDLSASSLTMFIKSTTNQFSYGFSYRPSYFTVSNNRYLVQHRLSQEFIWQVNDQLMSISSYSYLLNHNYQREEFDGNSHELSTDIVYMLNHQNGVIMAGLNTEINSTKSVYESYEQLKTKIGYQRKIPFDINATGMVKYHRKAFLRRKPVDNETRIDKKYTMSLELSRSLTLWLKGAFEVKFIKRDSNDEIYDYSKRIVGLYLTAEY